MYSATYPTGKALESLLNEARYKTDIKHYPPPKISFSSLTTFLLLVLFFPLTKLIRKKEQQTFPQTFRHHGVEIGEHLVSPRHRGLSSHVAPSGNAETRSEDLPHPQTHPGGGSVEKALAPPGNLGLENLLT